VGGQVPHPGVDVVTLGRKGMHTEDSAPSRPCFEIASVRGGGVAGMPEKPGRYKTKKGIIDATAR